MPLHQLVLVSFVGVVCNLSDSLRYLAQPLSPDTLYMMVLMGVVVGGFFFSLFLPLFLDGHLGSHKKKMLRLAEEQGKVKPDFDGHWLEGDGGWWLIFGYIVFSLIGIFLLIFYAPLLLLPICGVVFWLGWPGIAIALTVRDKGKQRAALKAAPKAPRGYWKEVRRKERRQRKIIAIILIVLMVVAIIIAAIAFVLQTLP
jgi:hypothetical protein